MPTCSRSLTPDMKLPSSFVPNSPEEFIGQAAQAARMLHRIVGDARSASNAPVRLLFNGPPGIGKSALSAYAIRLLGSHPKWSVSKYNGASVKIDVVEEMARALQLRDMFGYRVLWVDEADSIPKVAQVRFLTLLDDLPQNAAVIATSNCQLQDFEERFQTRFKTFQLEPPSQAEITHLLKKFIPQYPHEINRIATFCCGNVRAALIDADQVLQSAPQPKAA